MPTFPEIKEIARQLAAIGNNLNQIARYFNSGGLQSKSVTEEINRCISGIMDIRDVITEMAGGTSGNNKTHIK